MDYEAIHRKRIYENATLRVYEFNILFLKVASKLSLPETGCELLLEFCRNILPSENNLPLTYYEINKTLKRSNIIEYKLCEICESVLDRKKKCPSETCISNINVVCHRPIKVFILDIESQILFILNNHYDTIKKYTSNIQFYLNFRSRGVQIFLAQMLRVGCWVFLEFKLRKTKI